MIALLAVSFHDTEVGVECFGEIPDLVAGIDVYAAAHALAEADLIDLRRHKQQGPRQPAHQQPDHGQYHRRAQDHCQQEITPGLVYRGIGFGHLIVASQDPAGRRNALYAAQHRHAVRSHSFAATLKAFHRAVEQRILFRLSGRLHDASFVRM